MKNLKKRLLSCLSAAAMLATVSTPSLPSFVADAGTAPILNNNGTPNDKTDDYYEIQNEEQLFWFADLVNGTDDKEAVTNANAHLKADIKMRRDDWESIGATHSFNGIFDGEGHNIFNLKQTGESVGFFHSLSVGGQILRVHLVDCFMDGTDDAAGICTSMGGGMISECSFTGVVDAGLRAGGIVAYMYRGYDKETGATTGTIRFCTCGGSVVAEEMDAGGICGDCEAGLLHACVTTSKASDITTKAKKGLAYCGSIAGKVNSNSGAKVAVCYRLSENTKPEERFWDTKTDVGNTEQIIPVLEADMLSGKVCVKINDISDTVLGYDVLYQNLGKEYPTLEHHHTVVYEGKYMNDACVYENGFCIYCGDAQKPKEPKSELYEISNAGELYWFAEHAKTITAAKANLVNDIVINEKVLDANGKLSIDLDSARIWTPIEGYEGIFDGNGHTIGGIVVKEVGNGGLFGDTNKASIQNLGIVDSYIGKGNNRGGICAENTGKIENCYVIARFDVRTNCQGTICSTNSGSIVNCYGIETELQLVQSTSDDVGDAVGICYKNNGTIINCCYNELTSFPREISLVKGERAIEQQVAGKTTSSFSTGEICYLLNTQAGKTIFYQTVGTDEYPVLKPTSSVVYKNQYPAGVKYENFVLGDIDGNGKFENADIVTLEKYLHGETVTITNWKAADYNQDGTLDVFDLSLMRQAV